MTDQTTAHDRIAEAALAVVEAALGDTLVPAARAEALAGIAAVLPATADQAAVLREAAARIDNEELPPDYVDMFDNGARWAAKLLRRMADETAATETAHQPRRGDQFEAWLKTQRDEHRDSDRGQWTVLDNVLDQYRLHADTGTPLSGHVCEGQAVGDCECLEQPANGVRQDGAQR